MLYTVKKEEPESPLRSLPATPKSENDTAIYESSVAAANNLQNLANTNLIEHNYENDKNVESDFDEPENKKFILQPTPAQLGQAPLQRRKNLGGGRWRRATAQRYAISAFLFF